MSTVATALGGLLAELSALRIEAKRGSVDPGVGRERFGSIQRRAELLAPDNRRHRISNLGQWKPYATPPAKFSVTEVTTDIPKGTDLQQFTLDEWCSKLEDVVRGILDEMPNKGHRPVGTGKDTTDEPILQQMAELLRSLRANSPTAALNLIMRADRKAFPADSDDANIRRLVGKFNSRNGR